MLRGAERCEPPSAAQRAALLTGGAAGLAVAAGLAGAPSLAGLSSGRPAAALLVALAALLGAVLALRLRIYAAGRG